MRKEPTAVVSTGGLTFLSLKFRAEKAKSSLFGKRYEFSSRPSGMEFGFGVSPPFFFCFKVSSI